MVAFPATVRTPGIKEKACKQTCAAARSIQLYSLSSGRNSGTCSSVISSSRSGSSSRSRQSFSPSASSTIDKFTSLWEDDEDDDELGTNTHELPPIQPSDYMKTLLCQLAASISSINTAYAHQRGALNPYNMPALAIHGQAEGRAAIAVVSAADQAMVEELQRLSRLHSQLALLPHMLAFKEGEEVKRPDSMREQMIMKRYEGIITRFHDEMRRKDAVAEALKETLAKSMLKGEKLQQRVKSLEAMLSPHTCT